MAKDSTQNRNPTGKGGFQDRPDDINRAGRPKGSRSYRTILRQYADMTPRELYQQIEDRVMKTREDITMLDVLAMTDVANGVENMNQRLVIADRLDGKPKVEMSVSVDDFRDNVNDGQDDG
jgi:hypothetical protein